MKTSHITGAVLLSYCMIQPVSAGKNDVCTSSDSNMAFYHGHRSKNKITKPTTVQQSTSELAVCGNSLSQLMSLPSPNAHTSIIMRSQGNYQVQQDGAWIPLSKLTYLPIINGQLRDLVLKDKRERQYQLLLSKQLKSWFEKITTAKIMPIMAIIVERGTASLALRIDESIYYHSMPLVKQSSGGQRHRRQHSSKLNGQKKVSQSSSKSGGHQHVRQKSTGFFGKLRLW